MTDEIERGTIELQGRRPAAKVRWNRIGQIVKVDDLDVTAHINLDGLEKQITAKVREVLRFKDTEPMSIELGISVEVNGGPFSSIRFGIGRIEVELPKADADGS